MTTGPHISDDRPFRFTLALARDLSVVITLSVLALYAGSGFLIPLALAFLSFVLITAVSDRVSAAVGAPVWLANLVGVVLVLAGFFTIMFVIGGQATQFARAMGNYETALDGAVTRMVALFGPEVTGIVRDTLAGVDLSRLARGAVGGATYALNTFLLVSLYVAFLMVERRTLQHKLLLAAGDRRLGQDMASVMTAISTSLQSYLGVKTFISLLTAGISYVVFRLLGLEFAETWAVLTFALNFIPSIGSIVAVIFPALVSLVQFDSVTPFLIIVLFCGTVQFMIGNFLDPALLGRSLNMSSFVVILALTFWTVVWGLIGAFLSVPLTVCILIVFSHIPALRPVAILMSKDGRLSPET
ncbi:AI-2E family transporter [Ruegeria marina]|uniref:Predicted PurR-regulated permease PerM n=1 Tax=Ruegeria marina TaxID=639004 RepID=A0A1G6JXA7_9RHOB|nr:AI-2E family transporter [Ruegeria marina]SDC23354.1 Predicted PurR-regulated permease PerM [Ruegeria marina]